MKPKIIIPLWILSIVISMIAGALIGYKCVNHKCAQIVPQNKPFSDSLRVVIMENEKLNYTTYFLEGALFTKTHPFANREDYDRKFEEVYKKDSFGRHYIINYKTP